MDLDHLGHLKLQRNAKIYAEIDKKIRKNWKIAQRELSCMTDVGLVTVNSFVRCL